MYINDFAYSNLQGSTLTLNTVQRSFVNWYAARKKIQEVFYVKIHYVQRYMYMCNENLMRMRKNLPSIKHQNKTF